VTVRQGGERDLPAIAGIQAASPEAAQWDVHGYLQYDLVVAEYKDRVVGFGVARAVGEGESELLNLAVDPAFRHHGVGRRMVQEMISRRPGTLWLEVRETNVNARKLYKSLGFIEAGCRPDYYPDSGESAIVMKVHS